MKQLWCFCLFLLALFAIPIAAQDSTDTPDDTDGPYINALIPPYCNADGTDGFPPCESSYDNECYPGGVLEGKCDTSDANFDGIVETWEQEWYWIVGWYLARFNQGLISRAQFPIKSMLPPLPGDIESFSAICFDSSYGGAGDVYFTGEINEFGNETSYFTTDGSCTNDDGHPVIVNGGTIVQASSRNEAVLVCQRQNPSYIHASNLADQSYNTPADFWICWYEVTIP